MCGFLVCIGPSDKLPRMELFRQALNLQNHRGPYSQNIQTLPHALFGFLRLPIIDAHERSNQPFEFGPITLVFNGEIYNYVELAEQLKAEGVRLQCAGDTEVLAAALAHWGIEKGVSLLKGMYSVLAYDNRDQSFVVLRDRFGMKPLFYTWDSGVLFISSEIKSLQYLSDQCFEISEPVLNDYLRHGKIDQENNSFFTHVKRFPAASYARINADGRMQPPVQYWSLKRTENKTYDPAELQHLISEAVKTHLRSDFPLALALSGGVDSTVLAAYARTLSSQFFCLSSSHPKADPERVLIEKTCQSLDLQHEFVDIGDVENTRTIDFLLDKMDQPFISSTTLYQFSIRKAIAAKGYRVLMTGDGADEIFASYSKCLPAYFLDLFRRGKFLYAIKQMKALRAFAGQSFVGMIKYVLVGCVRWMFKPVAWHRDGALKGYIQERCFVSPLPYWLRVEDGMSMSLSLETRLPFLDHEIAEYVYNLPPADFFKNGMNKFFLRDAVKNIIPSHISQQKMKFQRPGNNDRLIFNILKEDMMSLLRDKTDEKSHYIKDLSSNKNSKFWFRRFLALRWMAIIEARHKEYSERKA